MDLIKAFTEEQIKSEVPKFNVGDTVRVHIKVKEGNRERIQVFEGTVIAKKHGGIEETFTVRRVSYGVGVEKVFPVHAPSIEKVEVVRHGKVRRAKLYDLRDRQGKAAKIISSLGPDDVKIIVKNNEPMAAIVPISRFSELIEAEELLKESKNG